MKNAHTSFQLGLASNLLGTNRPGTTLSLSRPQKALELQFIEADIRAELLGTYLIQTLLSYRLLDSVGILVDYFTNLFT